MCPMCEDDVKYLLHLILDCKFVQECWSLMGLSFDVHSIEDFPEWLPNKLTIERKDLKVQLVTVLWTIWNARNLKLWEGKVVAPTISLQWSNNHIVEWQSSRKKVIGSGKKLGQNSYTTAPK